MATAFIFETDGLSADQYDAIMSEMGLGDDTGFPAGCIAHLAGPMGEGGWRVVDVWDSEDAGNAFYGSDQFAPVRNAAESAGISTTPWTIHRVVTP